MTGADNEQPKDRATEALESVVRRAARVEDDRGERGLLQVAARFGEATAAENRTIEEALDALLAAAERGEVQMSAALLGAVFRGYTDRVLKLRGLVRRGGMGQLSSHVARLAALHRITQAATTTLDLDQMLETVVQLVKETMGGDSCSIFLYDPASATLTLRATIGLDPESIGKVTLTLGMGITGEAAAMRRVIAVADARSYPSYLDYPLIGDQPYTSQVSVPLALRSQNQLVGVLNILTLERREFDLDELAFLETAAGEIAIAIENARLYSQTDAELQRRLSQLATLQQMSRLVASTLDVHEVLGLISRQTTELADAAATAIYRRPRRGQDQLERLACYPEDEIRELDTIDGDVRAVVKEVMQSGASIWRRLQIEDAHLYVYALPLVTGRRAVGALCVFKRERPTEEETQGLLHAFSDWSAMAIENAELYEEARRGFTRASTLLQEMHHRVRNNLQTVAALLSMQARYAGDEGWVAPLQEAVSRIRSIAVIHDVLSSGNMRTATVDTVAKHVCDEASINVVSPGCQITFNIQPTEVWVTSRHATVLALLINEFVANAVVHGFAGRSEGVIEITADRDGECAVVEVRDNGAGVPTGFQVDEGGLGLQIARTLVEVDLRGTLEIGPRAEGGTTVRIRFLPDGNETVD